MFHFYHVPIFQDSFSISLSVQDNAALVGIARTGLASHSPQLHVYLKPVLILAIGHRTISEEISYLCN
jgi:hypothetical protein